MGEAFQNKAKALWAIASGPDPVGAVIEHYVTFLCSIPQLPELLAEYIEEFLEEATEERRAEMIGSLVYVYNNKWSKIHWTRIRQHAR